MRLLKTDSFLLGRVRLQFVERSGHQIPPYAIVTHRWGKDEDEVYLTDILRGTARAKKGFTKLKSALHRARLDGLEYLWMDTCCIDKTSSAELSEAINSMYEWYHNASKCYAYLVDVLVEKPSMEELLLDPSVQAALDESDSDESAELNRRLLVANLRFTTLIKNSKDSSTIESGSTEAGPCRSYLLHVSLNFSTETGSASETVKSICFIYQRGQKSTPTT